MAFSIRYIYLIFNVFVSSLLTGLVQSYICTLKTCLDFGHSLKRTQCFMDTASAQRSNVLVSLHWRRVPERIQYKICALACKTAPPWFGHSFNESFAGTLTALAVWLCAPCRQFTTGSLWLLCSRGPRYCNSVPLATSFRLRLPNQFSIIRSVLEFFPLFYTITSVTEAVAALDAWRMRSALWALMA